MRPQKFEDFYYKNVGLGEGCGCAEKIIDVHEFNRLAGRSKRINPRFALPNRTSVKRFLQKAGLTRRPSHPPD